MKQKGFFKQKIDPYYFPMIIIVAFLLGFFLAIALGFRPEYGDHEMEGHRRANPALVETVRVGDIYA